LNPGTLVFRVANEPSRAESCLCSARLVQNYHTRTRTRLVTSIAIMLGARFVRAEPSIALTRLGSQILVPNKVATTTVHCSAQISITAS